MNSVGSAPFHHLQDSEGCSVIVRVKMVHFGKDILTNQVPGWEEYVFLFLSQENLEITSIREFCKVQKAMELTAVGTYCIPRPYEMISSKTILLLFIVQVLPWIQGFEAKDQVLL